VITDEFYIGNHKIIKFVSLVLLFWVIHFSIIHFTINCGVQHIFAVRSMI